MANFATATAEENEILKADDVTFGYEAAIDNVALALQGVLGGSSGNYVIGGSVTPYEGGGLNVMVAPLYAYCADTGVAVVETDSTGPISFEEEEDSDRIDIIEVQGLEEGYDYQVRMFNDPGSGTKSSESMNTKKRIALSVNVKKGTPGAGAAPSVDEGYIKLAEVTVYAGSSSIQESQIANITAREAGEANEAWTADAAAAYNPGELTAVFKTFLAAHNQDGSHKSGAIDGDDIDWGTGSSQVKASLMPAGRSMTLYGTNYESTESVLSLLLALVSHVNALYPFANSILSRYEFAEVSPAAASTENISSLSGAMAVDGVAVSEGQAVLLKDQADKTQNGIWRVSETGAWTRYEGFAASDSEPLTHKLILVTGGTANKGKVFCLAGDSYAIGTDELEFQESILSPYELAHKVIVRDSDGSVSSLTATGQVQGATIKSTENATVGGNLTVTGTVTASNLPGDYTISSGIWHVNTAAGLLAWAEACKSDMSTSCVLEANIDMTGVEWTPVGTSDNQYTGYFDGGGHCIEGLTISSSLAYVGFFGYIGSAGACVGLHIGRTCSITGTGRRTGAVAGLCSGTVAHCSNAGTVTGVGGTGTGTSSRAGTGGIIGSGNCSHCVNSGTVKGALAGGIAGECYAIISNCDNFGTVTCTATSYTQQGSGYAGGILGLGSACVIASCANYGTVTGISGGMTGGIVGSVLYNSIITCCSNRGTAKTGAYVGAIAGAKYTNCTNQYYAVSSSGSPTTVNGTTSTY